MRKLVFATALLFAAGVFTTLLPITRSGAQEPPAATAIDVGSPELPGPDTGIGWSRPLSRDRLNLVYDIVMDADYDPETQHITGTQKLVWKNTATVPVTDLCFHHYLNAFSNNRTTFMKESGGSMRGARFEDDRFGWIEASSIRLEDGTELKGFERFEAPEDGNDFDRTVAYYPLPREVPPGGEIAVEIDFESRLPEIFARTGAEGDYVLAGQWFPKIGVFEDAGDRGRAEPGWNCHQFHYNSEFFAEFGDYDVTLTLPERFAGHLGATGEKVEERVEDGKVSARFVQSGVHDFAWTADPRFLVLTDRFDPATDIPAGMQERIADQLGLPAEEIALSPVDITLFLRPEHASQARRYFESAKAGIRGYGLRLGAYPYSTLTLVDPAHGAGGSGGMEYPTFITLGTHPLLAIAPFDQVLAPEAVTVHEFGHQFFQGMIASNEFEESWIDEGINSFYDMTVMDEEYGFLIRFLGVEITGFEQSHAAIARGDYRDPVAAPTWGYVSRGSWGMNSYPRPAVVLRHLEHLLGPEVFAPAMRDFFQTWRFRHPTTRDFEDSIQASAGLDLDWFFQQALHSTRTLDFAVRSAESRRVRDERGIFWESGERIEKISEDDDEDDDSDEGEGKTYRSRVVVERRGEFVHPVTVEFRFEDDSRVRREWPGRSRWHEFIFTGGSKLASVEVDPDHHLALDVNRLNNSRRLEPDRLPKRKLTADFLFWIQALFGAGALLG